MKNLILLTVVASAALVFQQGQLAAQTGQSGCFAGDPALITAGFVATPSAPSPAALTQACCTALTSLPRDGRVSVGAQVARRARLLAERDMRGAKLISQALASCGDAVATASFQATASADQVGLLLQTGDGTNSGANPISLRARGGGGGALPSPN